MKKTRPIFFAFILLALTLVNQMFASYNYSYYVDEASLISLQQASIAKIIFLIFDAGNDLFFGYLSEKFSFKFGKRKTWLLFGIPLFCASLFFTFGVDAEMQFSNVQFFIYYIVITILFDSFSSLLYVNYNALFPVLFTTETERTKSASWNHLFEIIGTGVVFLTAPLLKDKIGYLGTCLVYTSIFILLMGISLLQIHEPIESKVEKKSQSFSLRKTLKDVSKNHSFLWYMIASSSFLTILGTLITILPFLAKYTMKITGTQQMIITAIAFILIIVSLKVWSSIIKKKGHRYAYKMSFRFLPLIVFVLASSFNFWSTLIMVSVCVPFIGGILITPDLMMADIVDEDYRMNHVRREAALISISSFVRRFALMIAAVLLMIASTFFGYQDGSNPGTNPELTFRIISMVFLPCIAAIGTIASHLYLKFSEPRN